MRVTQPLYKNFQYAVKSLRNIPTESFPSTTVLGSIIDIIAPAVAAAAIIIIIVSVAAAAIGQLFPDCPDRRCPFQLFPSASSESASGAASAAERAPVSEPDFWRGRRRRAAFPFLLSLRRAPQSGSSVGRKRGTRDGRKENERRGTSDTATGMQDC